MFPNTCCDFQIAMFLSPCNIWSETMATKSSECSQCLYI